MELKELGGMDYDLSLTGFGEDEIGELLAELEAAPEGETDADQAPAVQVEVITRPGDVWQMGKHRVMCGDSTDANAVKVLMSGGLADLVVTDPPYGVSYADKNKSLNASAKGNRIQAEIENDHLQGSDLADFFRRAFSSLNSAMRAGCPFYVFAPQGGEQMMMQESGLPVRHELIWVKNNHVLGRADYHYKHEPVLYGWKEGAGHPWYGDRGKFSVWNVDKPLSSKLHPTMKPIDLVQIPIENSSRAGDIVLDLFGGSGSTLIACERTGRFNRSMELDPKYCDVIVRRWQQFTGKRAVHAVTGEPFGD